MKTNEELIEILKPALEELTSCGGSRNISDVTVVLGYNQDGSHDLKIKAYAKGKFIPCQSLDSIKSDVLAFDELGEQRREKEARIAALYAELAALQPKPTTAQ